MLEPELQGLEIALPPRGDAADVAKPIVGEHAPGLVVDLVEAEAGEIGGRCQASLVRAMLVLVPLRPGDVEGDAHQPLRLAGRREMRSPAGGDPPHSAVPGEDDPVLHLERPGHAGRLLEGTPHEIPVVGMDHGKDPLQVEGLVGPKPEERPGPLGGPEGARCEFQSPQPRLGGIRGQRQALLALQQPQLVVFPGKRVGEDLRDQLEPLHERFRPLALRPQGVEAQDADGAFAPHQKGEAQVRLDAEKAAALPVGGGLRRKIPGGGDHDASAGHHLLHKPGELILAQRLGRLETLLGAVEVRRLEVGRSWRRRLPEHRQIEAEELADGAQRAFDLAVHLAGRQVDEPRGELGEQRLELEQAPETPLQAIIRASRICPTGHGQPLRPLLTQTFPHDPS